MNRREALQHIGVLLGAAVTPSVAAAVLSGCQPSAPGTPLETLTGPQDELVATASELIIPATDTPGARAAGVDRFIDQIVTHIYTPEEHERFMAGLADLDQRAQDARGSGFVRLNAAQQVAILQDLEAEALQAQSDGAAEAPFWNMLKELTLVGYYTSEIGATQELQYVHAAGRYDGDVPLAEAGRAYA